MKTSLGFFESRNIFSEMFNAANISINGDEFTAMDTARDMRQLAAEVLSGLSPETVITRELYDADTEFGECLICVDRGFEFPDWEGRTLRAFLAANATPKSGDSLLIQAGTHRISLQDGYDATPVGDSTNGNTSWTLPNSVTLSLYDSGRS